MSSSCAPPVGWPDQRETQAGHTVHAGRASDVGIVAVSAQVADEQLGAGVASDDSCELAVALGFLEFVRESR